MPKQDILSEEEFILHDLLMYLSENEPDIFYKYQNDDDEGEMAYAETIRQFLLENINK